MRQKYLIYLFSVLMSVSTFGYEIQSTPEGRKLQLTACELRRYSHLFPDKLTALQKNSMRLEPVYGRSYELGLNLSSVKEACDKEIADENKTPEGTLTPRENPSAFENQNNDLLKKDTPTVAAVLSATTLNPKSVSVPQSYVQGFVPKTPSALTNVFSGAGTSSSAQSSPDSVSKSPADTNSTNDEAKPQPKISNDQRILDETNKVSVLNTPGANASESIKSVLEIAEKSNKPPSKDAVEKSTVTLENAAVALKSANDIVSGMKQGGLKGAASIATGAVDIAAMMNGVDVASMSANAGTFKTQVESATAAAALLVKSAATKSAAAKINADVKAYLGAVNKCELQLKTSSKLCSELTNPKAIAVASMMQSGASLLGGLSSASETCSKTSDLSKIAGLGMSGVGLMCGSNMKICTSDCSAAGAALKLVQADIAAYSASIRADGSARMWECEASDFLDIPACNESVALNGAISNQAQTLTPLTTKEDAVTVAPTILSCASLGLNVLKFAMQVSDLLKASSDADDCRKKLTAGGSGGAGLAVTQTMDQMCAEAANAQMLVCKCKADANTVGCPGAVVKNKDPGGIIVKGTGSGSQLAGMNNFSQKPGLSGAAKTALGLDSESGVGENSQNNPANVSGFGSAAGASGSGSGTSAGATASSKNLDAVVADDKSKSKFSFGGFGGGLGGLFGGSKKSADSQKFKEQQVAAVKRQIANEKMRSEISSASGKSNWDKVNSRYVENNSSFLGQ